MNHIGKTCFPAPLLEHYKTHPNDNKKELKHLFKKNEDVRKEFIAWSANHKFIVNQAPRLYAAEEIANKINSKIWNQLKELAVTFVNQPAKDVSAAHQKDPPKNRIGNYSKKNAIAALSLYHLKLINEEQFSLLFNEKVYKKKFTQNKLSEILSSDKYSPGLKAIFNNTIFTAFLPYLDTLVGKHLCEQFSITDENGRTPLFSLPILKSIIPIIKTQRVTLKLLSHQDKEGNSLYHFDDLLKEIMPILMIWAWKYEKNTVINPLLKLNHAGYAPLHRPELINILIPLLESLIAVEDFNSVYTLLSCKDVNGKTPLHYRDIYINIIFALKKLTPYLNNERHDLNYKLHTIQDNQGCTPLHFHDIMKMAVDNMPSMVTFYAKQLFIIQDKEGKTPLHFAETLKNAQPVLMRLKPDELENIISIKNNAEVTVRQLL